MAKFLRFYTHKNIADKIFVTLIAILSLTFFFPKKEIFKYEFSKGKIWNHEDLFSPFHFIVPKNIRDISLEIRKLEENKNHYFDKKPHVIRNIKKKLKKISFIRKNKFLYKKSREIINTVYRYGYLDSKLFSKNNLFIFYKKNKYGIPVSSNNIYTSQKVNNLLDKKIKNNYRLKRTLKKMIVPNLYYKKDYTEKVFHEKIKSIIRIKRTIAKGEKIIRKNEVIDGEKFQILSLFRKEYEIKVWNKKKDYGLILGYFLIISTIFSILLLYLFYFQNKIFQNNREINFLIINILLISSITIITLKYHSKILYLIPFCILPISIRAFFNLNLSLIIHLTTILLLSLITPNSFEFIFLQVITGFLVLLTKKNIYKMANLFIAVGKITITYIITFCSLTLIRKGSLESISLYPFSLFFLSGVLTLFVHPLIFLFEKLFNLTSDISLLELSDTNTPILRLLSQKAPGTLQHVLTVANIAEEAAVSIGANSLLTRIGAIYHDIGKIKNSIFFTENQHNLLLNPHEKLSPKESAKIILEHVTIGIELAKKYHLPDTITDFIRTHHGNSIIHYFYEKQKEKCPNMMVDEKKFQYSGPKPFSKETAIVMICDSIEAASKSIKNPSSKDLENLVENIINKQKKENQFSNADITLKEIEKIKQVLKKKLINIYHTRIEYPN
ncbi:putative membrane-associated HD superfamily hydrolase [Blattabacterium sp. (Periplaneta americana) str. BPLAN]|uniref:HD family phosphohydrolase n=1 Tax=Blattabacterium sp. (Periplaneta americana) TaxID=367488 RepID=UPI0001BA0B1A|nr:HDIG domain-containing metalloprotein [Blattabacterium sp. (Periplaneta americana)]ACX83668.1 putative membrane-associated HD superfamily hydrolase [Blattabacterium sp. (Periplaneta americana) str. BPLAN]